MAPWSPKVFIVSQALLTTVGLALLGMITTAVFGVMGVDISRHILLGMFSTMITLLGHCMMMFYFIGKAKAVKEAMVEGQITGDYQQRMVAVRKPVFSVGTVAMAVTMVAAIMGATADTKLLPPIVHGMIAYGAIACNLAAVKIEIDALAESTRIVDEVDRRLQS